MQVCDGCFVPSVPIPTPKQNSAQQVGQTAACCSPAKWSWKLPCSIHTAQPCSGPFVQGQAAGSSLLWGLCDDT